MPDSFYVALDRDRFEATELTRGPWDRGHQHVGPPSALLARAMERLPGSEGTQIGRMTVEILGPVPIGVMEVTAEIARPGRSVQLLEARFSVDGRDALRARAWRLGTAAIEYRPAPLPEAPDPAPPGPETGRPALFFEVPWDVGYQSGMEGRFVRGAFREPGPALAWLRMRVPLVAGEEPSPLARVMCAADSGNGVSSPLDYHRYLFVNTELTVHLHRYPEGEWIGMDSRTLVEPHGVGLTETALFDTRSAIGSARQCLFVRERRRRSS